MACAGIPWVTNDPEERCDEEIIGEYRFYAYGDRWSRFDRYIDEYIVVPKNHPLIGEVTDLSIVSCNLHYEKYNIFHWRRYYSHSQTFKRYRAWCYLLRNESLDPESKAKVDPSFEYFLAHLKTDASVPSSGASNLSCNNDTHK